MEMDQIIDRMRERGVKEGNALRVFLSSTGDMRDYRDAVASAMERVEDFQCIRMEDFAASYMSVDDYCRSRVRTCDLFVCLVGDRYGTTPRGDDRSYTLIEYETAKSETVPVLAYIAPEGFIPPDPTRTQDTPERAGLQRDFRQRIAREQTPGKGQRWESPSELALDVFAALTQTRGDLLRQLRARREAEEAQALAIARAGHAENPGDAAVWTGREEAATPEDETPRLAPGRAKWGAILGVGVLAGLGGLAYAGTFCSATGIGCPAPPPPPARATVAERETALATALAAYSPPPGATMEFDARYGILALGTSPFADAPFALDVPLPGALARHITVVAEGAVTGDEPGARCLVARGGALTLSPPLRGGERLRFTLSVVEDEPVDESCGAPIPYWLPAPGAHPARSGAPAYSAPEDGLDPARRMSLFPDATDIDIDPGRNWVRFRFEEGAVYMRAGDVRFPEGE